MRDLAAGDPPAEVDTGPRVGLVMRFTTDIAFRFTVSFAGTAEQPRHQQAWHERSRREGDDVGP
jgi:hypothetical protein